MKPQYSSEPRDKAKFTQDNDRFYTRFAGIYDLTVKALPIWKQWIDQATPHIKGPRVLEVSFGTGYLLTQYADRYETFLTTPMAIGFFLCLNSVLRGKI